MRWIATLLLAFAALLSGCSSGVSLDEPIEGPIWYLEQLGDQAIAPGNDPKRAPQIQFDDSGRVSGSGGCNRMTGSFERDGNALKLGQLAATRMACIDPVVSTNETQFFAALQATASYRLQGAKRMSLLDSGGRTLAVLSAAK